MKRVWATLLTDAGYLPGVLVLHHALRRVASKYPLVVLHTHSLDPLAVRELNKQKIPTLLVDTMLPKNAPDLSRDPRFETTWSKLAAFGLTQYERVVQLDCDMLPLQNMDELLQMDLGSALFASTHSCVCNPKQFAHYPKEWNLENCVYTNHDHYLAESYESYPDVDQSILGPACNAGLGLLNSGILVIRPDEQVFNLIQSQLLLPKTLEYKFPDQDLLADVFKGRWLAISYVYNALKTFQTCHEPLWDLSQIKNIHYILSPKPWNVKRAQGHSIDPSFDLWWNANEERIALLDT